MVKTVDEVGSFFGDYALDFDDIYDTQNESGLAGWLNRRLRASMAMRYERTFRVLDAIEGRSLLDIGCGSGRYMVTALKLGSARVVGIDLSDEMLGIARQAVAKVEGGGERAQFLCGDFMTQTFDGTFDYAIVMGVMDYVPDPTAFVRKVNQLVTKRAVFSFPVAESLLKWQRKVRYHLRRCPLFFYRRKDLDEVMDESGFRTASVDRIARDYFVLAEV